jgi:hypothetical protein
MLHGLMLVDQGKCDVKIAAQLTGFDGQESFGLGAGC